MVRIPQHGVHEGYRYSLGGPLSLSQHRLRIRMGALRTAVVQNLLHNLLHRGRPNLVVVTLASTLRSLMFSAGGLMAKDTAQDYKYLQKLFRGWSAAMMDVQVALVLTQHRAMSATSIIIRQS